MKRILVVFLLLAGSAIAQNYLTITAANIGDGSGKLLSSGTILFSGTDSTGRPISYQAGGGGQVIRYPVSCSITNGTIAANCNLANTDLTNPLHVCFNVTVKDAANTVVLGGSNSGYNCVQPQTTNGWCSAGTCNFDSYSPGTGSVAPALLRPPGASTLGGIFQKSCSTGQHVAGYDNNGNPICTSDAAGTSGIGYGAAFPTSAPANNVFSYFTLVTPAANPGLYECTTSPSCNVSSDWTLIGPGATTNWGTIGGNINNQTDLQVALAAKLDRTALLWGHVAGQIGDQTDLQNALKTKPDTSSLAKVATTNQYSDLNGLPLIPGKSAAFTMEIEAPTSSDSGKFMWSGSPVNIQITDISCTTDQGIAAINFEIRSASNWNLSGTSVLSGPMQCSSTPVDQTNFAVSNVSATSPLALMIPATSGLPSIVRIRVTYQVTQ